MISISKPKQFVRDHWQMLLFLSILVGASSLFTVGLSYAEGVFTDPKGQLNNPFKVTCDMGTLSNRQLIIFGDGEYNWMFAKGQTVNISLSTGTTGTAFNVQFASVKGVLQESELSNDRPIQFNIIIPSGGHWRLEIVSETGTEGVIQSKIIASQFSSYFGVLDCFTPTDLFKSDND